MDPYKVLELLRSASADEIKKSHRRLAFQYHPDRAPAGELERYQARFHEINEAFAILSDPEKKRKYDAGGMDNLEDKTTLTVDGDDLKKGGNVVAAVFSKLGLKNVRTTVPGALLEAVSRGDYSAPPQPLLFGEPLSNRCERNTIQLYELRVTDRQAQSGFSVSIAAPSGDKFKLLLFEEPAQGSSAPKPPPQEEDGGTERTNPASTVPEGGWVLSQIVDSTILTTRKNGSLSHAAAFFLDFDVYDLGPKPRKQDLGGKPENALFIRLEGLKPRERHHARPGRYLIGVYGDNFISKSFYTVEAIGAAQSFSAVQGLRDVEGLLLHKRLELIEFQREYERVKELWGAVSKRYESEVVALEDLIKERGEAYRSLMPTAASQGILERAAAASASPATSVVATSAFPNLSNVFGTFAGARNGAGAASGEAEGGGRPAVLESVAALSQKVVGGVQYASQAAKQGVQTLVERAQYRPTPSATGASPEPNGAPSTSAAGSSPSFLSAFPSQQLQQSVAELGTKISAGASSVGEKIKTTVSTTVQSVTTRAKSGKGSEGGYTFSVPADQFDPDAAEVVDGRSGAPGAKEATD